ncbi:hypothetical protein [Pseudomonas putida]|uniref:hypothetical protein n=1 Tax=Pseudomonas putida TaxID=303 RepID=UPI001576F2CA|nr:hypothetical protein [Pseudomonas putida]
MEGIVQMLDATAADTLVDTLREDKGSIAITSQIPELIICLQRFVPSPTITRIASP